MSLISSPLLLFSFSLFLLHFSSSSSSFLFTVVSATSNGLGIDRICYTGNLGGGGGDFSANSGTHGYSVSSGTSTYKIHGPNGNPLSTYTAGTSMSITIDGGSFTGYVIGIIDSNSKLIGTIASAPSGGRYICSASCSNCAIIQSSSSSKSSVTFTWTPPSGQTGTLKVTSIIMTSSAQVWYRVEATMTAASIPTPSSSSTAVAHSPSSSSSSSSSTAPPAPSSTASTPSSTATNPTPSSSTASTVMSSTATNNVPSSSTASTVMSSSGGDAAVSSSTAGSNNDSSSSGDNNAAAGATANNDSGSATVVSTARFSLTFNLPQVAIPTDFSSSIVAALSTALNVDPARISVVSLTAVRSSSGTISSTQTVVTFDVKPGANAQDTTPHAALQNLQTELSKSDSPLLSSEYGSKAVANSLSVGADGAGHVYSDAHSIKVNIITMCIGLIIAFITTRTVVKTL